MKYKTAFLNAFLCLILAAPGWAATKTATIQVSCVVPPRIELSAASIARMNSQKDPASGESPLHMTDELCRRPDGRVRLYTLTAF